MNSILFSSFGEVGESHKSLDLRFGEGVACDFSTSKKHLSLMGLDQKIGGKVLELLRCPLRLMFLR